MTSGLIPKGSLAPINIFCVKTTSAYPPWSWNKAAITLSAVFDLFDLAINLTIVSVSDVV